MKKYIKKILIFIILVIISLTAIFYVKADSGWDSDYGGGSDWGSSWDSDYGSSYGGYGCVGGAISVPILIIVIIFVIIALVNGNKNSNDSQNLNAINNFYPDLSDDEYNRYFGMSKGEFKHNIKEKFVNVQTSWMNFDYDNLRKLCTDELYNQYKTQLETLKIKNEQNIMSDFVVNCINVYKVEEVNDFVEVRVLLDISFKDYVINSKTGAVVRGNEYVRFNNCYELTFVSSKNKKISICPSCGASIDVTSSEVCEYCRNIIVQISNELVLSKKKIVSSRKY